MYYGNPTCTSQENISGTWDSDFRMVQHLNETSGTHYDSTSYGNDGTQSGGVNQSATGKIDGADWFDGSDDKLIVGYDPSLQMESNITLSVWVKKIGSDHTRVLSCRDSSSGYDLFIHDGTNSWNGQIEFDINDGNPPDNSTLTPVGTNYNDGKWHYIAAVKNATHHVIYVDGTAKITASVTRNINTNSRDLYIGVYGNGGTHFFNGTIDEVRISSIARNSSWINASYKNVNSTDFFTFGSQEIKNVAPTQSSPNPADGATGVSLNPTLSIQVNDTNADAMNVTFRTNATGVWGDIGSNNSVYNGTYYQTNSSMDNPNTKYWWSVNVTDGTTWTNVTYNFTTGVALGPLGGGSTNIHNFTDIINNSAWYGDNAVNPPNTIKKGSLFNLSDYHHINESDDIYERTNGSLNQYYPYQTYRFNITESDIQNIAVLWEGKGHSKDDYVYFHIWNVSNECWNELQNANASSDIILMNIVTNTTYYINTTDASLYLMITSNNFDEDVGVPSLSTDYVEIKVTT